MPATYDTNYIFEEWIYNTLAADADVLALVGRHSQHNGPLIYHDVVDSGAAPEDLVIIFQDQGGGAADAYAMGTDLIVSEAVYAVRVVGPRSKIVDVRRLAQRVHVALQGKTYGAATDGTVLVCTRERTLPSRSYEEDLLYEERGGIYLISAQPNP
jgi:hypothetical protein